MGLGRGRKGEGKVGYTPCFYFFLGIHPLLATVGVKAVASLVPVSMYVPMLAKIRVKFKKPNDLMGFYPIKN